MVHLLRWLINGKVRTLDQAADIQRVAKKYLVENGLTIATISPDDKPVLK